MNLLSGFSLVCLICEYIFVNEIIMIIINHLKTLDHNQINQYPPKKKLDIIPCNRGTFRIFCSDHNQVFSGLHPRKTRREFISHKRLCDDFEDVKRTKEKCGFLVQPCQLKNLSVL